MSKIIAAVLLAAVMVSSVAGKDAPSQVITWPESGTAVVRITLGKFNQISSVAGQPTI